MNESLKEHQARPNEDFRDNLKQCSKRTKTKTIIFSLNKNHILLEKLTYK